MVATCSLTNNALVTNLSSSPRKTNVTSLDRCRRTFSVTEASSTTSGEGLLPPMLLLTAGGRLGQYCLRMHSVVAVQVALPLAWRCQPGYYTSAQAMIDMRSGSLILKERREDMPRSVIAGSNWSAKTRRDNSSALRSDIPSNSLPRTFQVAVSLARQLRLVYFWMDSLLHYTGRSSTPWARTAVHGDYVRQRLGNILRLAF